MNVREEQHSFDIPVEELTACDQLQHQVHMRLRLEYLLQSNLKLTAQKNHGDWYCDSAHYRLSLQQRHATAHC